jgi:ribonuclease R
MDHGFRSRILDHLSHAGYRPSKLRDVERQMRIRETESAEWRRVISELSHDGTIEIGRDEVVRLARAGDEATGIIKLMARGGGWFVPDVPTREGDLRIADGATGDAVSGDRVRVRITRRGADWDSSPDAAPSGRVIEVLTRARTRFPGTLRRDGREWIVVPDGRALRSEIVVRDPGAKDARAGDKVVVDIIRFPSATHAAEGVITERLGVAGQADVETASTMLAYGLRGDFPEQVLDEAGAAARRYAESPGEFAQGREDLQHQSIFTIDPPDARDFDDAISIRRDHAAGTWELGVHIADVSAFVPRGSALDAEARARGTSAYLPRRVVPMLPETLSNGVCSLQEGVARLAKSVWITFDSEGNPVGERFASTVIRSRKRMTYLEAQAIIDGDVSAARTHARTETVPDDLLVEELRMCNALAKVLRRRRMREGMISLSLPDSELVFADDGKVSDVVPEDSAFTHTLIEMCMVEANEAVARLFSGLGIPVLRRIHPDPEFHSVEELRIYARAAKFRLPDEPTRQDLQALVDATRGTDAERAVHLAVLRSLSKAVYSSAMLGHFALASEHYCHFTSPIRRYPDLQVHRTLDAWLDASDNGRHPPGGRRRIEAIEAIESDSRAEPPEALSALAMQCSETEVNAERAERDLRTFLVLQFLAEHHMGERLPAIVTGIAPGGGGVFVTLEKYLVDGMIRSRDLSMSSSPSRAGQPSRLATADRWELNPATGRLHASRSGLSIGLGDEVEVTIAAVDTSARQLDLALVGMPRKPGARSGGSEGEGGELSELPSRAGRRKDLVGGRGAPKRERGHKRGFKQGRRGKRGR